MKKNYVLLTAAVLFVGLAGVISQAGSASSITLENPAPTPAAKGLSNAQVKALIDKLTDSYLNTTEDEGSTDFLNERWNERTDLAGKTRNQIVHILFADLRTQLDDQEILKIIWSNWTGESKLPPLDPPRSKPNP